jgi:hypothetical protein
MELRATWRVTGLDSGHRTGSGGAAGGSGIRAVPPRSHPKVHLGDTGLPSGAGRLQTVKVGERRREETSPAIEDRTMEDLMTLVRLVRRGDETAQEKLFDALYPKIYGFVARRTASRTATDTVVSEVFLQFIVTLPQIEESGDVLRAAFRITKARLVAREREANGQRLTA